MSQSSYTCFVCGKEAKVACSACRGVFYCAEACQKIDWNVEHRFDCEDSVEMRRVWAPTLYQLILRNPEVDTFGQLLQSFSNLIDILEWQKCTVFVPTNDAMRLLDDATYRRIMSDNDALERFLKYHIALGQITQRGMRSSGLMRIKTIDDGVIAAVVSKKSIRLNNISNVGDQDWGRNGPLHLIDYPLVPPSLYLP